MKLDPYRCFMPLVVLGFLFAPLPTVATISCYENADGTWTCSGGPEIPPGVIINPDGSSTCTNCVNMTPAQCEAVKIEIRNACDAAISRINAVLSDVEYNESTISSFYSKWNAFPDCPQMPSLGSTRAAYDLQVGYFQQLQQLYGDYTPIYLDFDIPTDTSDLAAFRAACESVLVSFGSIRATSSYNPSFLCEFLYAYYHGVYQYIQVTLQTLNTARSGFAAVASNINYVKSDVTNIRDVILANVICSNCVLSASSGSGSGSGSGGSTSDNFCPECLKVILNEISQKITVIHQKLDDQKLTLENLLEVSTQSRNFLEELVEKFKDFSEKFDTYSSNLTNLVLRIDDYLEEDQRINLNAIRQAVIILSNDVDTVQRKFFTQAIKSLTFETPEKTEPKLLSEEENILGTVTNIFNSFSQNESLYKRYDWFSRVEMLLLEIAGPSSGKEESTLSSTGQNQIQSKVDQIQSSLDASSVNASFNTLANQVKSTYQRVSNLIPPGQPVSSVVLLDSGSWIGDRELTLNIPPEIQSCCHIIMVTIWTALALTVFTFYAMFFIPIIWKILLDITNVIGAIAGQNCT